MATTIGLKPEQESVEYRNQGKSTEPKYEKPKSKAEPEPEPEEAKDE